MGNPTKGENFFFHPYITTPQSPWISHPSRTDVTRSFSHITLMCSVLLPPIGSDPTPVPSGSLVFQHLNTWGWNISTKWQLSGRKRWHLAVSPYLFPLALPLIFPTGCKVQDSCPRYEFVAAPLVSKTSTPSAFYSFFSDGLHSDYSVC